MFVQSGIEDGDLYDGAWCAEHKDRHQWLEVDAIHLTLFTGVILQGRNSIWRSGIFTENICTDETDTEKRKTDVEPQQRHKVLYLKSFNSVSCARRVHYSWDWVQTYKVQLSNDSVNWETCMNGTEEAVRTASVLG